MKSELINQYIDELIDHLHISLAEPPFRKVLLAVLLVGRNDPCELLMRMKSHCPFSIHVGVVF